MKVLIIGQNFYDGSGGGVTLRNLFSNFNKNEIALATTYDLYSDDDSRHADTIYLLGDKEYHVRFPFSLAQKKFQSKVADNSKIKNVETPNYNKKLQHLFSGFLDFMRFLGLYNYMRDMSISQSFLDWYDQVKPDVVYTQLGSVYMLNFINQLIAYRKPSLAIHIMDDWARSLAGRAFYKKLIFRSIDNKFKNIISHSSKRICISDAMAHEYMARYGGQWSAFHNSIEINSFQPNLEEKQPSGTFRIMYFGRIGLANKKSIEKFIEVVESIDKNVSFHIYTPDLKYLGRSNEKFVKTRFHDAVSYEQVQFLMRDANLLLLPLDFSKESVDFIQLSMPTKMPEYMSSGTPIFIFAPEKCAVVEYANKHKIAITSTTDASSKLLEDLHFAIDHYPMLKQYAITAKYLAEKNHNKREQAARFREILVG
ncbi:MAG: glycosyltransferase [Verrucomicrobia bacterium]|nr:glycosyltransferase [Verrucomicrobiota bacterium]